jgi:ketosteroid isomerase-like protein
MKQCPVCGRTYGDDTLNFCLQDGVALNTASNAEPFDPEATIVDPTRAHRTEPAATEPLKWQSQTQQNGTLTTRYEGAPTTEGLNGGRRKNTWLVVLLSVAGTLVVLALGGLGVWLMMSGRKDQIATGNSVENRPPAPAASPRVSPTAPRPIVQPTVEKAVDDPGTRQSIMDTINGWANATRSRDSAARMAFYADRVDPYYLKSNVSSGLVKAESERAYSMFSTVDIQLNNMKIDVDPAGDKAVVTFDKSWNFDGSRQSSGAVQQRLWLQRFGDRWLITGEKDLKVYYKNR